jgi:hypothetical protein
MTLPRGKPRNSQVYQQIRCQPHCQPNRPTQVKATKAGRLIWHGTVGQPSRGCRPSSSLPIGDAAMSRRSAGVVSVSASAGLTECDRPCGKTLGRPAMDPAVRPRGAARWPGSRQPHALADPVARRALPVGPWRRKMCQKIRQGGALRAELVGAMSAPLRTGVSGQRAGHAPRPTAVDNSGVNG